MLIHITCTHHQQGRVGFNTVNPSKGSSDPLPEERLMMRKCPYSTKPREVLGNPSPPLLIFPMTFEVSLGNSLGSREISWASGMDFPIPPELWWSTDTMILSHVFNVGDNECCGNECCNECQCMQDVSSLKKGWITKMAIFSMCHFWFQDGLQY